MTTSVTSRTRVRSAQFMEISSEEEWAGREVIDFLSKRNRRQNNEGVSAYLYISVLSLKKQKN